jgi:hypothetical protein
MKNTENQSKINVKDLAAELIQECGEEVQLYVEALRDIAAKKAKAKSEQEFANTVSALRAKIQFPSKMSEKEKQSMTADRVMAWYLHQNHTEYKIKIPKSPKPKLTDEEIAVKEKIKATIKKLQDEGKSYEQVVEHFKKLKISVKSQTINMTMNPPTKKNKPNANAGKSAAAAAEAMADQGVPF